MHDDTGMLPAVDIQHDSYVRFPHVTDVTGYLPVLDRFRIGVISIHVSLIRVGVYTTLIVE